MPRTFCLKCGALSKGTYCSRHSALAGGTGQRGTSATWAATRRRILVRDGFRCTHYEQGERCTETQGLQVDHTTPLSLGGTESDENLRTLCTEHHRQKTAKENATR